MKRLGVNAIKQLEQLQSTGEILNDDEATAFKALAARANYLALDDQTSPSARRNCVETFVGPLSCRARSSNTL